MTTEDTIIGEWLKSLSLEEHVQSFIDNGYDDLEICKQISAPDLDAIGVIEARQRTLLLEAVLRLREEGAASVYFTVEEALAARGGAPLINKKKWGNESNVGSRVGSAASTPAGDSSAKHFLSGIPGAASHRSSLSSVDAYEAGKAELVRLPQTQLRNILSALLTKDGVNLTVEPYTSADGSRGVLEGLASRFADQINTHYQDVIELLDQLRTEDCEARGKRPEEISREDKENDAPTIESSTSKGQLSISSSSSDASHLPPGEKMYSLHQSSNQAIYVPGKYNPSSCLSDAEEDEIYGYTGNNGPTPPPRQTQQGYLNPRSQFIYELPPVGGRVGGKRRLGIGRLIKTLRRDLKRAAPGKQKPNGTLIGASPHLNTPGSSLTCSRLPQSTGDLRTETPSSTPLMVLPGYYHRIPPSPTPPLHSHQLSNTTNTTTLTATGSSASSPRGSQHSSSSGAVNPQKLSLAAPDVLPTNLPHRDSGLQEAIERLKEQETQRRRHHQLIEHQQVMRDLQQGLLRRGDSLNHHHPSHRGTTALFYDTCRNNGEEVRKDSTAPSRGGGGRERHGGGTTRGFEGVDPTKGPYQLHWYDEPPYESDPEDFLIPGEEYYSEEVHPRTVRDSLMEEDVISLRTAGDISISRVSTDTIPLLAASPTGSYYYYYPHPPQDNGGENVFYETASEVTYREPYNKKEKRKKSKKQQNEEYQEPFCNERVNGGTPMYHRQHATAATPMYDNISANHFTTITGGGSVRGSSSSTGGYYNLHQSNPPPLSNRNHLHLRGLSSQQYMMHQQQELSQMSGGMGECSSPDYNLRWDLHNITAAAGPSRLLDKKVKNEVLYCDGRCGGVISPGGMVVPPPSTTSPTLLQSPPPIVCNIGGCCCSVEQQRPLTFQKLRESVRNQAILVEGIRPNPHPPPGGKAPIPPQTVVMYQQNNFIKSASESSKHGVPLRKGFSVAPCDGYRCCVPIQQYQLQPQCVPNTHKRRHRRQNGRPDAINHKMAELNLNNRRIQDTRNSRVGEVGDGEEQSGDVEGGELESKSGGQEGEKNEVVNNSTVSSASSSVTASPVVTLSAVLQQTAAHVV